MEGKQLLFGTDRFSGKHWELPAPRLTSPQPVGFPSTTPSGVEGHGWLCSYLVWLLSWWRRSRLKLVRLLRWRVLPELLLDAPTTP